MTFSGLCSEPEWDFKKSRVESRAAHGFMFHKIYSPGFGENVEARMRSFLWNQKVLLSLADAAAANKEGSYFHGFVGTNTSERQSLIFLNWNRFCSTSRKHIFSLRNKSIGVFKWFGRLKNCFPVSSCTADHGDVGHFYWRFERKTTEIFVLDLVNTTKKLKNEGVCAQQHQNTKYYYTEFI